MCTDAPAPCSIPLSTLQLSAFAELAGVWQAEQLASVGICSDQVDSQLGSSPPCSCSPSVVLAAAPAAARWSPARHRHFPPAFKQAVRQLLLVNRRLVARSGSGDSCSTGRSVSSAGGRSATSGGGSSSTASDSSATNSCASASSGSGGAASSSSSNSGDSPMSVTHTLLVSIPSRGGGLCTRITIDSPIAATPAPSTPTASSPANSGSTTTGGSSGGQCAAHKGGGAAVGIGNAAAAGGLPLDALHEVIRHLGAGPLSFWLQPQAKAVVSAEPSVGTNSYSEPTVAGAAAGS